MTRELITFGGDDGAEYTRVPMADAAQRGDLAQAIVDETEEKRIELIEALADLDDGVADLFLDDEEMDAAFLKEALRRATVAQEVVPVFMGTALRNTGVQPLLDGVEDYLPDPSEAR